MIYFLSEITSWSIDGIFRLNESDSHPTAIIGDSISLPPNLMPVRGPTLWDLAVERDCLFRGMISAFGLTVIMCQLREAHVNVALDDPEL